jgi:uncharacterized OsmC-like protein
VKADPELAAFRFRATNRWVTGTHNQSTVHGFYGARQEMTHEQRYVLDADHPSVLVGHDNGPTPVEYVLHALAACLTAGIVNIAAARNVMLTEVRSVVEQSRTRSAVFDILTNAVPVSIEVDAT